VSYHGRTFAEGKKIGVKDGIAALWHLVKFRFLDTQFTTHEGYYILQSVRKAKGFNRWMYKTISKYVGNRVLEVGGGRTMPTDSRASLTRVSSGRSRSKAWGLPTG
jgi:hypothetical protein